MCSGKFQAEFLVFLLLLLQLAFVVAVLLQEHAFDFLMPFLLFVALLSEGRIFFEEDFGFSLLLEVFKIGEFGIEVIDVPFEIV